MPRHVGQLPVYYNQVRGQHGNRYADLTQDPAFVFGQGLSYTTFEYGCPTIEGGPGPFTHDQVIHASIPLTNTGDRPGVEVVQAYVRDLVTSVTWADRELKAYKRVSLEPGQTAQVELDIPVSACSIVDSSAHRVVEDGEFDLLIGHSSNEDDLQAVRFSVTGTRSV